MTQRRRRRSGSNPSWWGRNWQWVLGTVAVPALLLIGAIGGDLFTNDRANDEVRIKGLDANQLAQIHQSGSALDRSIAAYFDAVAEQGMLARGVRDDQMDPSLNQSAASSNVTTTKSAALQAFRAHSGDVQVLRSFMPQSEVAPYFAALASVRAMLDRPGDIQDTAANVRVLASLVAERNRLADRARARLR